MYDGAAFLEQCTQHVCHTQDLLRTRNPCFVGTRSRPGVLPWRLYGRGIRSSPELCYPHGRGRITEGKKKKLNSPNTCIYARDFTTWGVTYVHVSLPQLILTKPGTKQRNRAQPRVHTYMHSSIYLASRIRWGLGLRSTPSICRGVPLVARVELHGVYI